MSRHPLVEIINALARSLRRANEDLRAEADDTSLSYLVTELEIATAFGTLTIENGQPVIDLEPTGEEGGGRTIRLKVLPVPTAPPTATPRGDTAPDALASLRGQQLDSGIAHLVGMGLAPSAISVEFDPDADMPSGSIISYTLTSSATGISGVGLIVAGQPATLDEDAP